MIDPYANVASGAATTALVLVLVLDSVMALAVLRRGTQQGDPWVWVWALITLVVPFIPYAIYMAGSSREEDAPDMSVITRELRGGRIRPAPPQPPPADPPRRRMTRPRNYF